MEFADRLEAWCERDDLPESDRLSRAGAVICVGGRLTRDVTRLVAQSEVKISTRVDWPEGLGKPTVRQIEAVAAAKDGTHAVALMAHPGFLVAGDFAALRDDVMGVVIAVREVSRAIEVRVGFDPAWCGEVDDWAELLGVAVREAGGDGVVIAGSATPNDPQREKQIARLCHHAGPLHVTALLDSAEPSAIRALLDVGVGRVAVPWGILSG